MRKARADPLEEAEVGEGEPGVRGIEQKKGAREDRL